MRLFKQVISLTVLTALLTSVFPAEPVLQRADAAETDLIFEDFSDYYGGNPSGTTGGNGVGQSEIVSDFQGVSYQLQSSGGDEQLMNTIKYNIDEPLSSGTYLLSFDVYFENAPNLEENEKGRLFTCKIAGPEKKTGQTFIVGPSGYMGFNTNMVSWDASNAERFLYQAQKWYCVDMLFNLDDDAPYIDYYIDGTYQGSHAMPMTETSDGIVSNFFPISQISFVLEDRKTTDSMYLDNILLTKADSRNLLLASEPLTGGKSIDVHLPISLRKRNDTDTNVDVFLSDLDGVSVKANGESIEVTQIEQLTAKTFRLHLAEELPEGTIVCTVQSDVNDIVGNILKTGKSVSFTAYKTKTAEELLGEEACDAKAYLTVDEIISDGIHVGYEGIEEAIPIKRQGVSGIRIAPIEGQRELLFDIDDTNTALNALNNGEAVEVTVLYFDSGDGELSLFYDSEYLATDYGGKLNLTNTNQWKTHTFTLAAPQFSNRLNGGYDFKLTVYDYRTGYSTMPVIVAAATVKKIQTVAPIYIKTKTEKLGNIFYTGEKLDFSVSYLKLAEEGITDVWQRTIRILEYDETETDDTDNRELWRDSKEISFLKSARAEEKVTLPELPYGLYKLEVSVESAGYICTRSFDFSVVKSAKNRNNDGLGVCMHYALSDWRNWDGDPEPLLNLYDNAGFGWVRDNFTLDSYATAQKDEDGDITGYTYQMPERWSKYISAVHQREMDILPIAEGGIGYTTPLYEQEKQAKFAEAASNFAAELYAMGVDCFELFNEYDNSAYKIPPKTGGTINYETYYHKAKYYAQFLKEVYAKVKEVQPEFNVVGGVTANIPTSWLQVLFAEIEALGVTNDNGSTNPLMDVLSVHPYISYPTKSSVVSGIANAETAIKNGYVINDSNEKKNKPYEPSEGETIVQDMQYTGDLPPVWATEFGKSTAGSSPATPTEQASHIVKYYLISRAYNTFEKMFVYSYKDNSVDAIESEAEYGIIKANLDNLLDVPCAAKPAYAAIANLNYLISDTYDADVIYDEDEVNGTLIRYNQNDGSSVYALWDNGGDTFTYDFQSPLIYYYDIYGNESCMEEENGVYTIPATGEIAYVKVPLCQTPLYTIDRTTNTLVMRGKTEASQPELSLYDLRGNEIESNLQLSGIPKGETKYTLTVAVPTSTQGYEFVLQDGNYIRRMHIPLELEVPQLQITDARYMLALNAKSGEVCISGISNPAKNDTQYMQAMSFYPGQQSASMTELIPAWMDQQNISDCGEYEFSFVTPIVVGDYRLVLTKDGEENVISFSLDDGVELLLIQNGVYIDSLSELAEDKPVAVELRISEELQSKELVLILGCYTNDVLTSCSYQTLSELTRLSHTVYQFIADAASLKGSEKVKVLLWKDIKSVTPVKRKEF